MLTENSLYPKYFLPLAEISFPGAFSLGLTARPCPCLPSQRQKGRSKAPSRSLDSLLQAYYTRVPLTISAPHHDNQGSRQSAALNVYWVLCKAHPLPNPPLTLPQFLGGGTILSPFYRVAVTMLCLAGRKRLVSDIHGDMGPRRSHWVAPKSHKSGRGSTSGPTWGPSH